MLQGFRSIALWLVMDGPIPLGKLAPWVFGFGVGRMPHRVKEDVKE